MLLDAEMWRLGASEGMRLTPPAPLLNVVLSGSLRVQHGDSDHNQSPLTTFVLPAGSHASLQAGSRGATGIVLRVPEVVRACLPLTSFWKLEHPNSQRSIVRLLCALFKFPEGPELENELVHLLAPYRRIDSATKALGEPLFLRQTDGILRSEFANPWSLSALADQVGVHPVYLARSFRQERGCSVGQFVGLLRTTAAARLILDQGWTMGDAAQEAGFFDQAHFSKGCERTLGLPPKSLRQLRTVLRD